jgi:branched-chain amino acid transport system substrate-binding protein
MRLAGFAAFAAAVTASAALSILAAQAQISDDIVKIGVMNDMSGLYADLGGQG